LFAQARQLALLGLDHRHRALHHGDVGVGHPARPDVARLHVARLPRIFLHRDRRGDASLLRDPCARRRPVPRRRTADGVEPVANGQRAAVRRHRNAHPRSCGVRAMSLWSKHAIFEKNSIVLVIGVLIVIAIGGLVEITPLFYLKSTIETVEGMRPYTPLELAGRNIYVREGCYNCHSQMIRALRDEVERYGHYSLAAESMYDRPFQWGSKRTGPDLARVGGKYSDDWHRDHLNAPKSVVPGTVMPAYPWLA